jgi:hypothetical protein
MLNISVTQGYDCDNCSLSGIAPSDPLSSVWGGPRAFVFRGAVDAALRAGQAPEEREGAAGSGATRGTRRSRRTRLEGGGAMRVER